MFENKNELIKTISNLKAEISMLEGHLKVKDTQIAFFQERGDRYFTQVEHVQKETSKLLDFAKEVLLKSINQTKGNL